MAVAGEVDAEVSVAAEVASVVVEGRVLAVQTVRGGELAGEAEEVVVAAMEGRLLRMRAWVRGRRLSHRCPRLRSTRRSEARPPARLGRPAARVSPSGSSLASPVASRANRRQRSRRRDLR